MDKYEYKIKADEIKALIAQGEYQQAAEIADSIDWRRVKSVMMLCTISDLYKINRRYEDSRNILLLAYDRHPGGRTIVYSLCELSIKIEDYLMAIEYYKEFVQIAPRDTGRYILQYKLYQAQDVSLEERIAVLEELKSKEYREKWAYELAYLYHRVGLATKCVEECDELILWFGEGKYVVKAMELKMLHQPLTPAQQEKYDGRFQPEPVGGYQEESGEEQRAQGEYQENAVWPETETEQSVAEEAAAAMQPADVLSAPTIRIPSEEIEIQVKTMDVGQYNTINLQKELAEGLREVLEEEQNQDELTRRIIAPMLEDADAQQPEETEALGVEEEESGEQMETEVFFGATGEIGGSSREEISWQSGETLEGSEIYAEETGTEETSAVGAEGVQEEENSGMPVEEGDAPEEETGNTRMIQPVRLEDLATENGFVTDEVYQRVVETVEAVVPAAEEESSAGTESAAGVETAQAETPESSETAVEVESSASPEPAAKQSEEKPKETAEQEDHTAAAVMEQLRIQTLGIEPPKEMAGVLSMESDGQISLVVPETEKIEKQITGQMSIEDILAEWERMKRENEEKRKEDIHQRVLQQTGPMFSAFEASIRDGLLEQLEQETESEDEVEELTDREESAEEEIFEEEPVEEEPLEEAVAAEESAGENLPEENMAAEESAGEEVPEEEFVEETVVEETVAEEEFVEETVVEETGAEETAVEETVAEEEVVEETAAEEIAAEEGPEEDAPAGKEESLSNEKATEEIPAEEPSRSEESPLPKEKARVRSLTREEKELYGTFIQSKSSREKLITAIDSISMASYTGNVILTGDEGMDTLTLAKNMIREVQMTDSNFSGRIAKISGNSLNQRDVAQTLDGLANGALIIQKASEMNQNTVDALYKGLQQEQYGLIIIMEDTRKAMNKFLEVYTRLAECFNARMDMEALSNDALVAFGRKYAKETEYSIDELGVLALHSRIAEMQTSDHAVTIMDVKEIMDEAIRHANRKTVGHFMDILLAKRYDEEDMIILRESDFM